MLAKIIIIAGLITAASSKNITEDVMFDFYKNLLCISSNILCDYIDDGVNDSCYYTESNGTYIFPVYVDPEDVETTLAELKHHPRIRHGHDVTFFAFDEEISAKKVKRAAIWFFVKKPPQAILNKLSINLFRILETGFNGPSGSRESPVITSVKVDSTQSIPNGSGAWITMEYIQIKNLVAEWFRYPQHNLGIVLTAEDANRTNLAVTSHTGNNTAYLPFLEVYVTDNRKHRTKRTVGLNCKDSSKETRCCRYPLTVDFLEFGWDWIIAPRKYEAFYCAGECPPAFLPQYPHTYVSQLANTPGNGPCCAPRKLSELEMLYFDQNMNIIFGRIPAMKVDRCGCT